MRPGTRAAGPSFSKCRSGPRPTGTELTREGYCAPVVAQALRPAGRSASLDGLRAGADLKVCAALSTQLSRVWPVMRLVTRTSYSLPPSRSTGSAPQACRRPPSRRAPAAHRSLGEGGSRAGPRGPRERRRRTSRHRNSLTHLSWRAHHPRCRPGSARRVSGRVRGRAPDSARAELASREFIQRQERCTPILRLVPIAGDRGARRSMSPR